MEKRIKKINQYMIVCVISLAILVPWQYEHSIIPIPFAVYIWVVYEWGILAVWYSKLYVLNGQRGSKTERFYLEHRLDLYIILLVPCFFCFALIVYFESVIGEEQLWIIFFIGLLCLATELYIAIYSHKKKLNASVFLGEQGFCSLQQWPVSILYSEIESVSVKGLVKVVFQMKSGKEISSKLVFVSDGEKRRFMEVLTAKIAIAHA